MGEEKPYSLHIQARHPRGLFGELHARTAHGSQQSVFVPWVGQDSGNLEHQGDKVPLAGAHKGFFLSQQLGHGSMDD